jgi:hypothetical protein
MARVVRRAVNHATITEHAEGARAHAGYNVVGRDSDKLTPEGGAPVSNDTRLSTWRTDLHPEEVHGASHRTEPSCDLCAS